MVKASISLIWTTPTLDRFPASLASKSKWVGDPDCPNPVHASTILWNVHTGVGGTTRAKWSLATVSSIWSHRWAQSGFCTCIYLMGGRLIQLCNTKTSWRWQKKPETDNLEEKCCFQSNGWRRKKKYKIFFGKSIVSDQTDVGWKKKKKENRKQIYCFWFSIKQVVGGGDGSHTPGTAAGQRHLVSCTPPTSSSSPSSPSSSSS